MSGGSEGILRVESRSRRDPAVPQGFVTPAPPESPEKGRIALELPPGRADKRAGRFPSAGRTAVFEPRPHLSHALSHLRFSVQLCALALGLCLAANVGVWAVVHFTDARWTEQTVQTEITPPPRVVDGGAVSRTGKEVVRPTVLTQEVVRVPSAAEVTLRDSWRLSAWIGSIAAVALLVLMLEGVVVAGGANVPGVEKAVTATSWTLALVMLCLPLQTLLPAFPTAGVFSDYASMALTAESIKSGADGAPGQLGFIAERFLIPVVCLAAAAFVAIRFTAGVEAGVISRSVGEAELRLMDEMERSRKASSMQGRAQGALSVTLQQESPPERPEPLQRPLTSASPGKAPGRVI